MSEKITNEALNRLSASEFKNAAKRQVTVLLDNVRSLNNVGSVFRTADAFLIEKLILCGVTGTPPNKEIEKTALGATSTVSWEHSENTLAAVLALKADGVKVYAVEQAKHSLALNAFNYDGQKLALVFGNEVYGVEQEVIDACHGVIEIPQAGTKHSLNIAVSAGIVLWEVLKNTLEHRKEE
ncbi:MAG: RNA methyltransferase [Bacteroidia bacterium]|nr:RNA methyltransferase [Bacteroidia bacterium]